MRSVIVPLAAFATFVVCHAAPAQDHPAPTATVPPAGSGAAVTAAVKRTDPEAVANEVLRLFRAGDVDALVDICNAVNRRKFTPLNDAKRARLKQFVAEALEDIGPVQKVSEIREGPSFEPDSVVGKIRQVGHEMFVVVLTREGENYGFEDINSPDAAEYARLKLKKSAAE